jgi:acyl dehydratase
MTADAPINTPYYFEDFTVGQTFQSPSLRVTAEAIRTFAAEFDPQPMHTDEKSARDGPYGTMIASGWHTAAIAMRLNIAGGLPPIAGGVLGAGLEQLSWQRPVRPGDDLRVENEVIAARRSRVRPEKGVVTVRNTTYNQRDEPVQIYTANLMVPCRDPRPPQDEPAVDRPRSG